MEFANIEVVLSGGLGNQLFQLAAAAQISGDRKLIVNQNLTKVALNHENHPQVMDLLNSDKVGLSNLRGSFLQSKFVNLALRVSGIRQTNILKSLFLRIIESQGRFFFPGYQVVINRITHKQKKSNRKILLVGYFQGHSVRKLDYLNVLNYLDLSQNVGNAVREEIEIAIHIRGGDYKYEKKIGMLTSEYYKRALGSFELELEKYPLHVFTNDQAYAESILDNLKIRQALFHFAHEETVLETFFKMQSVKRFIISNSTFSWWAAYLNVSQNPVIVFPKPWFKDSAILDNVGLDEWLRETSIFY